MEQPHNDPAMGHALTARLLPLLPPRHAGPAVVAVAGPSGVGKSTLAAALQGCFAARGLRARVLAMDDFFHDKATRARLDEWSPAHVRLADLTRVLDAARQGAVVRDVPRYVRRPRPAMEPWVLDFSACDVLLFEGLYTLSPREDCARLGRFAHCGLFLDAPDPLLKTWRFQQEAAKPHPRTVAEMEHHWTYGIEPDTRLRVRPSRIHADVLLVKSADHGLTVSAPDAPPARTQTLEEP